MGIKTGAGARRRVGIRAESRIKAQKIGVEELLFLVNFFGKAPASSSLPKFREKFI